jgi:hypothetical protein
MQQTGQKAQLTAASHAAAAVVETLLGLVAAAMMSAK